MKIMDKLTKRNVVHYFISDISVFVSVYLTFLSMVWITFKLTDSPADLGLVGFVQNIPFMLFSVYGGVVADNHNRLKIVVRFNIAFVFLAALIAVIQITGLLSFPIILFFSFMLGSLFSIYYPSFISLVKNMVTDPKEFPRVMGAAASNAKVGQLLASSALSFLITAFTIAGTFVSAFIFNVISLFSITRLKGIVQNIVPQQESVKEQIVTGFKYVWANPPLVAIVLLSTIISTVFIFVSFQMPMIDSEFLHGATTDLGILFIAGAIGGLTSGIYLGKRKSTKNLLWFLIICAFVSGASIIGLAFSRHLWLSFIFAMGVDFAFIATMGIGNTLLQLLSEEGKIGRVLGTNTMMSWGFASLVMMLFGFLAKPIGIEAVMIIIGIMAIISGVIYIISIKAQRPKLNELYQLRNIPPERQPV
jgi:MFS family permease